MFSLQYDPAAKALNMKLRDGHSARTIEVDELVLLDVDAEGRPLSLEFVIAEDFLPFLERHGGQFDIPDRVDQAADASANSD